jgi:hypothetical protein
VLDGEGGEVGVGNEIAERADIKNEMTKDGPVALAGLED